MNYLTPISYVGFKDPIFPPDIFSHPRDFPSVDELQVRLQQGTVTSVALVVQAFARIEALNKKGPCLNAVIETNPDAISVAQALDAERASGVSRGPMHGIPLLLKANIDTADAMQTCAGSLAMVGEPAAVDAAVVSCLRDAGAIILGKANMSEWAGFRDWAIPYGWSGRAGLTRNPLSVLLTAHGSSSGSAVGVAAGFVPVAVGTETNGSIINPALFNQVVGFRPSFGLISNAGLVPLMRGQDTPGPMARSVRDVALLLAAMQGPQASDYAAALDAAALSGTRIGYRRLQADGTRTVDLPAFRALAQRLERAGAVLVPADLVFPDLMNDQLDVICHEFKRDLKSYLSSRTGLEVADLAQVIAFNDNHAGGDNYDQGLLRQAEALSLGEDEYSNKAGRLRQLSQSFINEALSQYELAAFMDLPGQEMGAIGAQAGYPGLIVPTGPDAQGQPTGLYLAGTGSSDQLLLSLGHAFEQTAA